MPTINYDKCNAKPYQFAYALGANTDQFFDRIIKINVNTQKTQAYSKKNCIPSEPIFCQNPTKSDEDDGVLLSVLFNTELNQTELHCIDAKTMQNISISTIDGLTGFSFHGQFQAKKEN